MLGEDLVSKACQIAKNSRFCTCLIPQPIKINRLTTPARIVGRKTLRGGNHFSFLTEIKEAVRNKSGGGEGSLYRAECIRLKCKQGASPRISRGTARKEGRMTFPLLLANSLPLTWVD
ncbi:hypothetical protein J6590_024722 [Homalodisca vitripennis]|nr:hypothetical protein J6590_024722 [Homalodisca vitripennis]